MIDTNLLLVLLVGAQDRNQIPRFKRTRRYTVEDYDHLANYVAGFRRVVVTPDVLTEVSNLAGQLAEPLRSRVLGQLGVFAATQAAERYVPSSEAVKERDFLRLGLADATVVLAANNPDEKFAVLTDDVDLYTKLLAEDVDAVNFFHLRFNR
ncbi:MAG TPA: hypothetical protein VFS20_30415 [Longimicrobium sp.]|nr:hypothetical protein [Longimicrobium sp.]